MTIGAIPVSDGVRFEVWTPTTERVEVEVYGAGKEPARYPLERDAVGYHTGVVRGIGAGARYRYRLDGESAYPDPASRAQPEGVHGPSEVVDPGAFVWTDGAWQGLDLDDLVIYELHVGTFTPAGTFDGAIERLDDLVRLGCHRRGDHAHRRVRRRPQLGLRRRGALRAGGSYGGPDGFQRLVDACHRRGLGILLDVVYNHLGPEGNYLPAVTGGRFFTSRHHTPWGDAVNYDGPDSRPVRDFVVGNALLLGQGIPRRWAPTRRHPRDPRRLPGAHPAGDRRPDPPAHAAADRDRRGRAGGAADRAADGGGRVRTRRRVG